MKNKEFNDWDNEPNRKLRKWRKKCKMTNKTIMQDDKTSTMVDEFCNMEIPDYEFCIRTPKNCGECSVSDCYYCDSKPITRPPQNFVCCEVEE